MSVDLDVVEARWRIGLISANDLHGVANELLDEGVSTDSLIDLFALPVDITFWEGPALFDRALSELGRGQMTEAEAARVLSRHIARGVLSGALEPPKRLRARPRFTRARNIASTRSISSTSSMRRWAISMPVGAAITGDARE